MRTKALLLTGLLTLAGTVASFAQSNVYSVNVVGYVTVTVTNTGSVYRILNTPLGPAGNTNNFTRALMPAAPEGTQVSKLTPTGYETATFGFGDWDLDLELAVGTGFFIRLGEPGTLNITFVGEVMQGPASNRQLPVGLSLVGSLVPQAGSFQSVLQVPGDEGNQISRLNPQGGYESATFGFGSWDLDFDIGVAEGFFYSNNRTPSAPIGWTRNFVIQ